MLGKNKDTSPLLIALLTGKTGDKKTIAKISYNFGQLYTKFLPKTFKEEIGISVACSYVDCKSGKFSQIINSFKENFIFYQASLDGWSPNFFVGCSNNLIIILIESLLNADQNATQSSLNRPLSVVEKKLAQRVLTAIYNILHQFVSTSKNVFNPLINGPYEIDILKQNTNSLSNEFVTAINMNITIENTMSLFTIIVPQETLLKTTLISFPIQDKLEPTMEDYNDLIFNKTCQLYVNIETRINLAKMTIKDVLQLKVGKTIPFLDRENTRAIVSINGKETYSCEFGHIDKNYTVRIKDRINFYQEGFK